MKEMVKAIEEIASSYGSLFESLSQPREDRVRSIKPSPVVIPDITLESLNIPTSVREKVVSNIRGISRLKLVMILMHFSKRLTYKNIMTVSKELGKPITYGWLDTDFQRKEHREFIKSEPISGSQEKMYSLTEPGKKRAESIVAELKEKEPA